MRRRGHDGALACLVATGLATPTTVAAHVREVDYPPFVPIQSRVLRQQRLAVTPTRFTQPCGEDAIGST